jgi:hypothetical protein
MTKNKRVLKSDQVSEVIKRTKKVTRERVLAGH